MSTEESWRLRTDDLRAHDRAVALTGCASALDYRTLAGRAEAIADALAAIDIEAGDPVALVSVGRAHDEAVALAGIHLAQAVAVPLDASSPALRLSALLRDRACRALVHDSAATKLVASLDSVPARIELDDEGFILASIGDAAPAKVAPQPALGCILHTSGSTGTPKAVPITWRGLDAFTAWMVQLVSLAPSDRVLRVAELVFDLSLFDHLATWRAGATLCTVTRRKMAAGRSLAQEIDRLEPTVIYGVPALFTKLMAALPTGRQLHSSLRIICFAGEVFPPRELQQLGSRAPQARLFNLFGPTETNVCTFHEVERSTLDGIGELPIGISCPYAQCRLVDEHGGTISGPGVGELVVTGPTALAGEVFTGDRVERAGDGLFYFRGRMDRMVKIQGFRVEPAEVEAALLTHPRVLEAAVTAYEHPRLGRALRAAVALRAGDMAADARALRAYLSTRLAPYMVPDRVDLVDALPRTTTGKIDYRALSG